MSTTPLILGNSTNNNTDKVIIAMVGQVHINLPLTMVAVPGDFIIAGIYSFDYSFDYLYIYFLSF